MSYSIHNIDGWHRNAPFTRMALMNDFTFNKVDGVGIIMAEIETKWFIIAATASDDGRFSDIGPFETVEETALFLKLRAG